MTWSGLIRRKTNQPTNQLIDNYLVNIYSSLIVLMVKLKIWSVLSLFSPFSSIHEMTGQLQLGSSFTLSQPFKDAFFHLKFRAQDITWSLAYVVRYFYSIVQKFETEFDLVFHFHIILPVLDDQQELKYISFVWILDAILRSF